MWIARCAGRSACHSMALLCRGIQIDSPLLARAYQSLIMPRLERVTSGRRQAARRLGMRATVVDGIKRCALRFPGIWIPIAYAAALLALCQFHTVFDEWGGVMQLFSGQEILAGKGYHGWASYFWPPLFSFMIGIGSLIMSGFVAGKLISILSASALLLVGFHLAQELFQRRDVGWWAQVFVLLSPIYVYQSLLAHNHMLDSLFFVSGLYLFLRSIRDPRPGKYLIAGLVCGLAALTRYTSYVLLGLPFFVFILKPGFWRAVKLSIVFWIGFGVICLPWWYSNTVDNGSPFYSLHYLNICTSVIAHNPGTNRSLWWCADQNLKGMTDIVATYPREYVKNLANNVYQSIKLLMLYGGALAPFVLPAALESIFLLELRHWITIFGTLSFSILLISQAFVNEWYLLSWLVPIVIITVMFLLNFLDRATGKYPVLDKYHIRQLSLAFLAIAGLALTCNRMANFITDERDYLLLGGVEEATRALKEHDPDLQSKVVMANDPGRAYYAGSKYLVAPEVYEGPVDGMVSYEGISEQLKNYAPKYPSSMAESELKADYLIYFDAPEIWRGPQELPQFSFLLDPKSDQIPSNFELVYEAPNVVAYEVHW
jgi:4-amino-4-deoxy-L-arabinose transferase-like glycosyltransferase